MDNIHSTFTLLAPALAGINSFYQLFYHNPAGDLIASGLRREMAA
jgi:hypothetical protein